MGRPEFDARDEEIRIKRIALLDAVEQPRTGDYVIFADGVTRRVSYVWDIDPAGVQTSDGGSWHLGEGHCSFSGTLHRSVPLDTLTRTDEIRDGRVWFFHHGWAQADNGVETMIPFRVYRCSLMSDGEAFTCDCGAPLDKTLDVSMCRACFESCQPAGEEAR